MKGQPVGTIFVELNMDDSRYLKSQQRLYKDATTTTLNIEANFKKLGIKSAAEMDLMRAKITNSYNMIANSSKATANDILRAEKAKNAQLKALNEQQYGAHTSMISKMKANWIAASAAIIAAWYAVSRVVGKASAVVLASARYETLGIVMRVVGNNAGYTGEQMNEFQKGLEKTGISISGARQALTRMSQAQLDLTKSSQLARIAQDAAVIGNMNSTEAFNQMVYGIQSANVRVLRTIGINVSFEESYQKVAKQLGRTAASFSETEKTAIRLQAVLDKGPTIAGAYEAAMETAGKQLLSMERHFENLEVLAGAAFTPALAEIVEVITGAVVDLNGELSGNSKRAIEEWGVGFRINLISIEAEFMRLAMLLDRAGQGFAASRMLLYGPGSAMGFESSEKRFEASAKSYEEYGKRYAATDKALEALALKQIKLEQSLTVEGKAATKAMEDALEKKRLAAVKTKLPEVGLSDDELKKQKRAIEKITEAIRKNTFEIDAIGKTQYEKDIIRINQEADRYRKAHVDEKLIAQYVSGEIDIANRKLFERAKQYSEEYYKTRKSQIERDAEQLVKSGLTEYQAQKWLNDELKKLTIERNDFILEHTKDISEFLKITRESELLSNRNLLDKTKTYSEEYYKSEIKLAKDKAERLIKLGYTRLEAQKWLDDELKKLTIEKNNFILEHTKDISEFLKITRESELLSNWNLLNKTKNYSEEYYKSEMKLAEDQAELLIKLGYTRLEAQNWLDDELKKLTIERDQFILEHTNNFAEGMASAWEIFALSAESAIKQVADLSVSTFKDFSSGIGNAFANAVIYGEDMATSLGDLWDSLKAKIISTLIDIGIQRAVQWAIAQVMGVAEATSRLATLSAETYAAAFASTAAIPIVGPGMAPAVAAASVATMLAGAATSGTAGAGMGATIASYDSGGISHAKGVYQTGDIDEAHIPLKGGKVPVNVNGGGTQIVIKMDNPTFQDVDTQRRVFAQIAEVIATRVAPNAIVQNYNNDGVVRKVMRGR